MILATSLLFSFLLDVLPTPDSLEIKIYFLNEFKMSEKCLSKVCDEVNHDLVMTRVRHSLPLFCEVLRGTITGWTLGEKMMVARRSR